MEAISLLSGIVSLFLLVLVVSFMISTSGNLRKIREEAEAQRRLLAQIEKNTRPLSLTADIKATSPAPNYMDDGKGPSVGVVLTILVVLFVILLIIALATK
jgi:uncharacterized membrane protein